MTFGFQGVKSTPANTSSAQLAGTPVSQEETLEGARKATTGLQRGGARDGRAPGDTQPEEQNFIALHVAANGIQAVVSQSESCCSYG